MTLPKLNANFQVRDIEEWSAHCGLFIELFKAFPSQIKIKSVGVDAFKSYLDKSGYFLYCEKYTVRDNVAKPNDDEEEEETSPHAYSGEEQIECYTHPSKRVLIYLRQPTKAISAKDPKGKAYTNLSVCEILVWYDVCEPAAKNEVAFITTQLALSEVYKFNKSNISFLCYSNQFYLRQVHVPERKEVNLAMNYGEEFPKIHDSLMSFLASPSVGLALLHGIPGTGKTSYIRHLLTLLDRQIVYVPPAIMHRIAEPDFLSFLLNYSNLILVIEDAENIVMSREESGGASGVTNLLNLTDGILGECIKVKCICTFNTELQNLDKALLRKGRLAVKHEFSKLTVEESNKLLVHLGNEPIAKEPMTLGEIYNLNYDNFHKATQKGPVGFGKVN